MLVRIEVSVLFISPLFARPLPRGWGVVHNGVDFLMTTFSTSFFILNLTVDSGFSVLLAISE